jgi:hypothetical protein
VAGSLGAFECGGGVAWVRLRVDVAAVAVSTREPWRERLKVFVIGAPARFQA